LDTPRPSKGGVIGRAPPPRAGAPPGPGPGAYDVKELPRADSLPASEAEWARYVALYPEMRLRAR
jgi:hypothetical protein